MLNAIIKNLNRQQWVSEAAYFKALARGFNPDKELEDWLEAEQEYLNMLIDLQLNVLEEDGRISVVGLRDIAESLGVENPERLNSEFDLIRAIQEASRHRPCFQPNGTSHCDEALTCQWRSKCRKLVAIWYR